MLFSVRSIWRYCFLFIFVFLFICSGSRVSAREIPLLQTQNSPDVGGSTFLHPLIKGDIVTDRSGLRIVASWRIDTGNVAFDTNRSSAIPAVSTPAKPNAPVSSQAIIQNKKIVYQTTQIINNYPKLLQGSTPLTFEGAANDGVVTSLTIINPTQTRTITIPNASGEVSLLGQMISENEIANNAITLGTKTFGDYVKSTTGGNGIRASGTDEGAEVSLALGNLSSNWNQKSEHDIVLNNENSELKILGSAGSYYATVDAGALSADATLTVSGSSGTLLSSTNYGSFITTGLGDLVSSNNLSDVLSSSSARTNLGLGSIATQTASSVAITGGTVSGLTSLNGLTLSSSSIQPASTGALTVQSNGANTLTLDTGSAAAINLGTTNATTVALGNSSAGTSVTGTRWSAAATGALTLSPTAASTTALTVNGTTNTTPADAVDVNLLHTGGTATNGLKVNVNGSGGTTTNALNITQAAGTVTNGLAFGGTIGTDIGAIGANRGLIVKANGTGTLTLDTTGAGTIQLGNTNATTLTLGNSASTLTLGGSTTLASGKTLAITTADSLTVGGTTIPQTLPLLVPLTATVLTQPVFIANANYQVSSASCLPTVAAGLLGTFQVTVETGTTASGSGTSQLTGTVSLSGTVNTLVSGTVIGSPTTIAAGDRVSAVFGGTLTGLLGTCTIYVKRV